MNSMYQLLEEEGKHRRPIITPAAIRHLPASRQRRYVRLAVLEILRLAKRDLSVSEIRKETHLDERTIRRELANLVATREVEMIQRPHYQTYRPIGRPTSVFSKHLVRLVHRAYTIEHVQSADGNGLLIIQERHETEDGTYEPIGGLTVSSDDFEGFVNAVTMRAEESFGSKSKLRRR